MEIKKLREDQTRSIDIIADLMRQGLTEDHPLIKEHRRRIIFRTKLIKWLEKRETEKNGSS